MYLGVHGAKEPQTEMQNVQNIEEVAKRVLTVLLKDYPAAAAVARVGEGKYIEVALLS